MFLCIAGIVLSAIMLFIDFKNADRWLTLGGISLTALIISVILSAWRKNKIPVPGKDYL